MKAMFVFSVIRQVLSSHTFASASHRVLCILSNNRFWFIMMESLVFFGKADENLARNKNAMVNLLQPVSVQYKMRQRMAEV